MIGCKRCLGTETDCLTITAIFNRLKSDGFCESGAPRGSHKNHCGLLKRKAL